MAKYRLVKTTFWGDPFIQELEPDEKLLYIYLLTNENTNICGIYEITERTICFDTGLPVDRVRQTVDRLSQLGKVKRYKNWIFIINFAKNQKLNPSIQQGIERALKELPQDVLDRLSPDSPQTGLLKPKLKLKPKPKLEVEVESGGKLPPDSPQTGKAGKILKILRAPNEDGLGHVAELLAKYPNKDLEAVALKCLTYSPFDRRWLRFVTMCGSEFDKPAPKKEKKWVPPESVEL